MKADYIFLQSVVDTYREIVDIYLDNLDNKDEWEWHGGNDKENRAQCEEVGHNTGAFLTWQTELSNLNKYENKNLE